MSSLSSVERTKLACRKGRGVMSAICNQAALGQGKLNPLTALRLYKSITIPSALFGCEVWTHLSNTENCMLERMQRYCSKLIQGLSRKTRSEICCKMLGLQSVEGYIDSAKMKFFRRIAALPSDCVSKQILIRRLFQAHLIPNMYSGFADELVHMLKKYNLSWALESFLCDGTIPQKIPWKKLINNNVRYVEYKLFTDNTEDDPDFDRFRRIHPDINQPSPVWQVARYHPTMLSSCLKVAKVIASVPNKDELLCEFCGKMFVDQVVHYVCDCCYTRTERDVFWDIMHDNVDIEICADLFNLEDSDLVDVILGGPYQHIDTIELHVEFLCIAFNFICKLMDKVSLTVE